VYVIQTSCVPADWSLNTCTLNVILPLESAVASTLLIAGAAATATWLVFGVVVQLLGK